MKGFQVFVGKLLDLKLFVDTLACSSWFLIHRHPPGGHGSRAQPGQSPERKPHLKQQLLASPSRPAPHFSFLLEDIKLRTYLAKRV